MERRGFLALLGIAPFVVASPLAAVTAAAVVTTPPRPTYRADGKWGSGKGWSLTCEEVDGNFWALEQRLQILERA